ncbi:MAG: AMP-binding protein [Sphingomonadaceae bacterium]|jgi:acyl-CoA synthetase (AMP-forming)/AMP-acid ligase II
MKTLADLIHRNARFHGNRIAVIDGDRQLTHRQLADRAVTLAGGLQTRFNMSAQDRFVLLSKNRMEAIETLAASAVSSFILVQLNWRLAAAELAAVVMDAEPKVAIVDVQSLDLWRDIAARCENRIPLIVIGESEEGDVSRSEEIAFSEFVAISPPLPANHPVAADDVAHIIYTSGTTGKPKGAMLSQSGMLAGAEQLSGYVGHRPTDRIVVSMPLFHVGGIIEWYAVQFLGGSCVVLQQFTPVDFFQAVERTRATVAHLAPVMVKRLVEAPERSRYDISSLIRVLYGSAPVPPEDLKRANKAMGAIFNQTYGMTESVAVSLLLTYQQDPDGDEVALRRLASAGHPYPHTEVWIENENGIRCKTGEVGEVVARSAAQFVGYWRNPEATATTLIDGAVRTGDVGFLDEDGFLFIVDRAKDVIVSGGENIYSSEVENALMAHEAVREAAVVSAPDEKWGEAVIAHVVLAPGMQSDEAELIAHCRSLIAGYKRPREVHVVDALPRLPHGKIDKKALRARYWDGRDRMVS